MYTEWAGPTAACKSAWRKLALEQGGALPADLYTACLERCLPGGEGAAAGPLARHATPTSQPLFLVFRGGVEVAAVRGADVPRLMDAVRRCVAGDDMPAPAPEPEQEPEVAPAAPAIEPAAAHARLAPVEEQGPSGGESEAEDAAGGDTDDAAGGEGPAPAGSEPYAAEAGAGQASSHGTEAQEGGEPEGEQATEASAEEQVQGASGSSEAAEEPAGNQAGEQPAAASSPLSLRRAARRQ